jgi:hypothetical protein
MGEATSTAVSRGSSASERRGSTFSDKQIYQTVRDRSLVVVYYPTGEPVTGIVYGMDDYHWGVVEADGTCHLVHKSSSHVTLTGRLAPEDLRQRAEPFRSWVMKNHFRNQAPAA